MKKFEIGKSGETEKFNAWFNYCSREQIPYITIKKKTKYATIEWDYINLEPAFDKIFITDSEKHRTQLIELFKKYANKQSEYMMSNLTFFVQKIYVEDSEKFAEELYNLINNQLQQYFLR